jgi:hypothetical protein
LSGSTSGSTSTRPLWLVVSLLLAVAIIVPLLVNVYDRETPTFLGFPFYYWFQFLLVPVAALLTYTAFKISLVATARDREARGLPPRADESHGETR